VLIGYCGNVFNAFTAPLPSSGRVENTAPSIVASVSAAAEACFLFHYLELTASTRSTIPAFSRHVTANTSNGKFLIRAVFNNVSISTHKYFIR
jgi:hypothetical protein